MDSITAIFNICDYDTVLVDKNKTWQLLANLVRQNIWEIERPCRQETWRLHEVCQSIKPEAETATKSSNFVFCRLCWICKLCRFITAQYVQSIFTVCTQAALRLSLFIAELQLKLLVSCSLTWWTKGLPRTCGMKFKDFQASVLFSSTFKALNLGVKNSSTFKDAWEPCVKCYSTFWSTLVENFQCSSIWRLASESWRTIPTISTVQLPFSVVTFHPTQFLSQVEIWMT